MRAQLKNSCLLLFIFFLSFMECRKLQGKGKILTGQLSLWTEGLTRGLLQYATIQHNLIMISIFQHSSSLVDRMMKDLSAQWKCLSQVLTSPVICRHYQRRFLVTARTSSLSVEDIILNRPAIPSVGGPGLTPPV